MKKFKNFIEVSHNEEEQIEQIKQWLSENLIYIIMGITLGFGGLFSWNYYQDYEQNQRNQARNLYLNISDEENIEESYQQLKVEYPSSIYLPQAQLLLANYAVKKSEYGVAIDYLHPLTNHQNNLIAQVSKLNLAEVFIEQEQYTKAIYLLTEQTHKLSKVKGDSYFQALRYNLLGDIYYLQNKKILARRQYKLAKKLGSVANSELGKILDIKLQNIR